MNEIGIVGQGFVGSAIYNKFRKYRDVKTFDLDSDKCNSTKERGLRTRHCLCVFTNSYEC